MRKIMPNIKVSPMMAEVKLSYASKIKKEDRIKIKDVDSTVKYLRSIFDPATIEHCESMYIICLNRANEVLGWAKISQGGLAGTVCDPKIIFQIALNTNASGIILAHNHPSGGLIPSHNDNEITRKIKSGGQLLDISVLDHIILTVDGHYSYAENENIL